MTFDHISLLELQVFATENKKLNEIKSRVSVTWSCSKAGEGRHLTLSFRNMQITFIILREYGKWLPANHKCVNYRRWMLQCWAANCNRSKVCCEIPFWSFFLWKFKNLSQISNFNHWLMIYLPKAITVFKEMINFDHEFASKSINYHLLIYKAHQIFTSLKIMKLNGFYLFSFNVRSELLWTVCLEASTDDDECVFSESKHILNKIMVQECNERLSAARNREQKKIEFIAFSAINSSWTRVRSFWSCLHLKTK